ncbi:MAG: rod shape-determining protein MreD [Lachnospiraceae bacterium]|nr:rod shape-determining protein MreD [Lachnospiraceae bacterium]
MKRIVFVGLVIFLGFILQSTVFSELKLAGVSPNILLIITTFFGFMRGRKEGMITGFFCGLINDIFYGIHFGAFTLIYMLIGYLNGFFRKIFFGDDIKLPMLWVGLSDILYGFIMYAIFYLPRGRNDAYYYIMNIIFPEAVYTILVSLALYFIVYKLNEWLEKSEKRSESNLVR